MGLLIKWLFEFGWVGERERCGVVMRRQKVQGKVKRGVNCDERERSVVII